MLHFIIFRQKTLETNQCAVMTPMDVCQATNHLCSRNIEIIQCTALKAAKAWTQYKADFLCSALGVISALN